MIYMPAAARLQQVVDDRQRRHALITEGMVMLVGGESPSHIQDRLNGFLRPEQHDYFDAIGGPAETRIAAVNTASKRRSETAARHRHSGLVGVTVG